MTDVNAVLRRDRAVVIAAITTISVLAWANTLWLAAQMGNAEQRRELEAIFSGKKGGFGCQRGGLRGNFVARCPR